MEAIQSIIALLRPRSNYLMAQGTQVKKGKHLSPWADPATSKAQSPWIDEPSDSGVFRM
jgi:hypothetical protein